MNNFESLATAMQGQMAAVPELVDAFYEERASLAFASAVQEYVASTGAPPAPWLDAEHPRRDHPLEDHRQDALLWIAKGNGLEGVSVHELLRALRGWGLSLEFRLVADGIRDPIERADAIVRGNRIVGEPQWVGSPRSI